MIIGIHHRPGSYSDTWVQYCRDNHIQFQLVNCYDSNIIKILHKVDGLMWHWNQNDYKAALFAKQLSLSIETMKINVFPNASSSWHFDDKVGQKYLMEAINAPIVPSFVFYSKAEAVEWVENVSFPKVFKLRGGAGAVNVRLAKTKKEALQLINKAFGKGFDPIAKWSRLKDRVYVFKRDRNFTSFKGILSGLARLFIPLELEKFSHTEKGYIYFQEFIENNEYDTRLVVLGNRCFGLRRYCRKGDFRASGSGIVAFEPEYIDIKMVEIAFNVSKQLGAQSLAFDFIMDKAEPLIIELSYCFSIGNTYNCLGFWDTDLTWHEEKVDPQIFMIQDFIESINCNT